MTTVIGNYTSDKFIYEIEQIPSQYLLQLFQIVHLYKESITKKVASESFEESWKQSLNGETYPIENLWDGIDEE
jgi:hypothetical protein